MLKVSFQASKWVHISVFPTANELESLFQIWGEVFLYLIGVPLKKEDASPANSSFISYYASLLDELKRGEVSRELLKKMLPLAVTLSSDALYLQPIQERYLVKVVEPVVQIQAHFFRISSVDSSFHSGAMGKDGIFWGLTFSYPGLFLDPNTGEVQKESKNQILFQKFRKWSRDFTLPTPFILPDNKKVNVPFRLGKEMFSWISCHPSLKAHGIQVAL